MIQSWEFWRRKIGHLLRRRIISQGSFSSVLKDIRPRRCINVSINLVKFTLMMVGILIKKDLFTVWMKGVELFKTLSRLAWLKIFSQCSLKSSKCFSLDSFKVWAKSNIRTSSRNLSSLFGERSLKMVLPSKAIKNKQCESCYSRSYCHFYRRFMRHVWRFGHYVIRIFSFVLSLSILRILNSRCVICRILVYF